jgi:hypothetical protein
MRYVQKSEEVAEQGAMPAAEEPAELKEGKVAEGAARSSQLVPDTSVDALLAQQMAQDLENGSYAQVNKQCVPTFRVPSLWLASALLGKHSL